MTRLGQWVLGKLVPIVCDPLPDDCECGETAEECASPISGNAPIPLPTETGGLLNAGGPCGCLGCETGHKTPDPSKPRT